MCIMRVCAYRSVYRVCVCVCVCVCACNMHTNIRTHDRWHTCVSQLIPWWTPPVEIYATIAYACACMYVHVCICIRWLTCMAHLCGHPQLRSMPPLCPAPALYPCMWVSFCACAPVSPLCVWTHSHTRCVTACVRCIHPRAQNLRRIP